MSFSWLFIFFYVLGVVREKLPHILSAVCSQRTAWNEITQTGWAPASHCFWFYSCLANGLTWFHCFTLEPPEYFHYTKQGGEMQIAGTDDLSDLERTRNAFTVLGILLLKSHDCMNIKFNNMTNFIFVVLNLQVCSLSSKWSSSGSCRLFCTWETSTFKPAAEAPTGVTST